MKRFKTFATMFAALAAMILLSGVFTLKASAAERATYYVEYDPSGKEWFVRTEAEYKAALQPKHISFLYNNLKNGDAVVVYADCEGAPLLDLDDIRLGNLTVLNNSALVMVKCAGVADFYALTGSTSSVSAPVINAYVYDPAVVNFNYNVQNIMLSVDGWSGSSAMAGLGTVGSLKVSFSTGSSYTVYNFRKGTFHFVNGAIDTPAYCFDAGPAVNPFETSISAPAVTQLKDLFDEHYYADRYSDLKMAFGYDREALWTHYITCGVKEGRDMNPIFNVTKYRNMYSDLNAVFGDNWEAYLNHYLTLGFNENRRSGADYDMARYANWYDDLKNTYGNNILALWKHCQIIGIEWSKQP